MDLEQNNSWVLAKLPKEKMAIGCKWIYKVKCKPNGEIERLKAHLVAKSYNQIEGLDHKDRLFHVVKLSTIRILNALATNKQWPIFQLDVNNAFLYGHLDEEVYMVPP